MGLAEEIHTTQATVSRSESGEPLPREAFMHLQDLVLARTGSPLPAQWYFNAPNDDVLLSHFGITLPAAGPDVTGKSEKPFPAAGEICA